jgi:hypothetical protein
MYASTKESHVTVNLQIDGTLPRRGTAVELTVRFNPNGPMPVPKTATLVFMLFVWVWEGFRRTAAECRMLALHIRTFS